MNLKKTSSDLKLISICCLLFTNCYHPTNKSTSYSPAKVATKNIEDRLLKSVDGLIIFKQNDTFEFGNREFDTVHFLMEDITSFGLNIKSERFRNKIPIMNTDLDLDNIITNHFARVYNCDTFYYLDSNLNKIIYSTIKNGIWKMKNGISIGISLMDFCKIVNKDIKFSNKLIVYIHSGIIGAEYNFKFINGILYEIIYNALVEIK